MDRPTGGPPRGGPSDSTVISKAGFQAIIWTCFSVAAALTAMRGCIRWKIAGRLLPDDFAVLTAFTLFLTMCAVYQSALTDLYNFSTAVGDPTESSGDDETASTQLRAKWQKYQFAIYLIFWTTLWTVKASFLLFFHRLLVRTITRSMLWWYLVVAFTAVTYVACVGLLFGSCQPFSEHFTKGRCVSSTGLDMGIFILWFAAACDVLTDILIMILPWQLLWGLQINLKQKLALVCVFSLSGVIILFALIRVAFTSPGSGSYNPISVGYWSILESAVAMVVACLPSLQFLVTNHRRNRSGYSTRGYEENLSSMPRSLRGGGPDIKLGNLRSGLGTISSVTRGTHKMSKSDSQERIIPYEGIYVVKDVIVTQTEDR